MSQPAKRAPDSFKSRALTEAARYGSDRWVFIRELLQNSRDAGATTIELRTDNHGRISCLDDGDGMSFNDARRYLFALYASSKDEHPEQAGKFGIGFWSVLRFEPSTIVVRSRVRGQEAWRATLDGGLSTITIEEEDVRFPHRSGTEITLISDARETSSESARSAQNVQSDSVLAAARLYGRFLTRRDDTSAALSISVDGLDANRAFALEPPCASFEDAELRGVVGLAREPLVELFAQGLFVRATPSIRDLAAEDATRASKGAEEALASVPSLAPRLILDGRNLDLLLARSDARQDRAMTRLVRRSEKELRRLLRHQLRALRPEFWFRPWLGRAAERLRPLAIPVGLAVLGGVALAAAFWFWSPASFDPGGAEPQRVREVPAAADLDDGDFLDTTSGEPPGLPPNIAEALGSALQGDFDSPVAARAKPSKLPRLHLYSDLSQRYSGPSEPGLDTLASTVVLRYEPAMSQTVFNALVVSRERGWSWTQKSDEQPLIHPYRGVACASDECLSIELAIDRQPGLLRLPVPTGHVVVDGSLELDGTPILPGTTSFGEPAIELHKSRIERAGTAPAILRYRTGPGPAQPGPRGSFDPHPVLDTYAEKIRQLPLADQPAAAVELIARKIIYDRSARTPDRAELADLLDWTLAEGRGDCDVQNAILSDLLRRIGLRARLVVGYIGSGGVAEPGLHAWVEADLDGSWHVLDASFPTSEISLPTPDRREVQREPRWIFAGGAVFLVASLALAGLTVLSRRRRSASLELGSSDQLAPILSGALQHPAAFADLPALFHGRFIPRLESSKAISLHTAKTLADAGRLFSSRNSSDLALRAIHNGVIVVDAATEEGAIAASVLGAIELDEWSSFLEAQFESSLTSALNVTLAELGESWRVYCARNLPQPLIEVDLQALKIGPRTVLLDANHPRFAWTDQMRQPGQAEPASDLAFTLAVELVEALDLDARPRARILSTLGGSAVLEAFGR